MSKHDLRASCGARDKKAKVEFSVYKEMAVVIYNWQEILFILYMPRGSTINLHTYCEVLKTMRKEIRWKCSGCIQNLADVFLIHNNA